MLDSSIDMSMVVAMITKAVASAALEHWATVISGGGTPCFLLQG